MTDASGYFNAEDVPAPSRPGRYVDLDDVEPVAFLEGLQFRPVTGERVLVSFARYEPNTVVPAHAHEEEQITFVLEGEFEFDVDGETRVLRPGTVAVIPPGVPHAARTYDEPCLQVDVFAPPRRLLLDALRDRGED